MWLRRLRLALARALAPADVVLVDAGQLGAAESSLAALRGYAARSGHLTHRFQAGTKVAVFAADAEVALKQARLQTLNGRLD